MVACAPWRALGGCTAGVRALAFLPSQVLLPCRYRRSSGCASKSVGTRKSSSYLARRLATAGLQLAAVMMICIRIIQHYTRGRFVPILALWRASCSYRPAAVHARKVFEMLPAFSCISWACVFAGDGAAIFFQRAHWATRRGHKGGVLGSMGWLIWNFMVYPLLGEEDSALSPRWL